MIIIMKRMCRKNYRKIVQKKIIGTINKSKNNKSYNDKNINELMQLIQIEMIIVMIKMMMHMIRYKLSRKQKKDHRYRYVHKYNRYMKM